MRGTLCAVALGVFSIALLAADNPFLGTWKLDSAKSKFSPGTQPKDITVTFESDGDQVKRHVTGVDADGEKIDMSATIPWDGKPHRLEGPPGTQPVMVSVKRVNERTLDVTVRREQKVLATSHVIASVDGKTVTVRSKGEDPKGRKMDNVEVYVKQ